MILAFELTWTGTVHALTNGALLQTVAQAAPGTSIRVHGSACHLDELARDAALQRHATVSFHPVEISSRYRGRTGLVSWRRFPREYAVLRRAVRAAPRDRDLLLLLLSATPTALFAVSLIAGSARGRRIGVQTVLHGNLNDASGWRSRNPLRRFADLRAMLDRGGPDDRRFIVLEPCILHEMRRIAPAAAARTDVIPLPINPSEVGETAPPLLTAPIRIGFVGQATEAKGIDMFLRVAERARARHGDRVAFSLVGRVPPGSDLVPFGVLAEPVGTTHLTRAEFVERLARLHYVLLPFRPGYYDLSASGALVDAITWLKPVIATRIALVESLFSEFGRIGHLCEEEQALNDTLDRILTAPDPEAYAGQVAAMRRLRESREPARLADSYRVVLATHYAAALPAPTPTAVPTAALAAPPT